MCPTGKCFHKIIWSRRRGEDWPSSYGFNPKKRINLLARGTLEKTERACGEVQGCGKRLPVDRTQGVRRDGGKGSEAKGTKEVEREIQKYKNGDNDTRRREYTD